MITSRLSILQTDCRRTSRMCATWTHAKTDTFISHREACPQAVAYLFHALQLKLYCVQFLLELFYSLVGLPQLIPTAIRDFGHLVFQFTVEGTLHLDSLILQLRSEAVRE